MSIGPVELCFYGVKMVVGAVSSEPVSHVDKRTKDEHESPGSVPEYPASESSIDSASSSRRLEMPLKRISILPILRAPKPPENAI